MSAPCRTHQNNHPAEAGWLRSVNFLLQAKNPQAAKPVSTETGKAVRRSTLPLQNIAQLTLCVSAHSRQRVCREPPHRQVQRPLPIALLPEYHLRRSRFVVSQTQLQRRIDPRFHSRADSLILSPSGHVTVHFRLVPTRRTFESISHHLVHLLTFMQYATDSQNSAECRASYLRSSGGGTGKRPCLTDLFNIDRLCFHHFQALKALGGTCTFFEHPFWTPYWLKLSAAALDL